MNVFYAKALPQYLAQSARLGLARAALAAGDESRLARPSATY